MNSSVLGIIGLGNRVISLLQDKLELVEKTYGKLDRFGVATFYEGRTKFLETQGSLDLLSGFSTPARLVIAFIEQTHPDEPPLQPRPELYTNNALALVYTGQLANAKDIRFELSTLGFHFETQCESEVVLRLIYRYFKIGMSLSEAVRLSLKYLEGDFALIVLDTRHQELLATRQGYALTIGVDQGTLYIGSNRRILNLISYPMLQIPEGEAMILHSLF